MSSKRAIIVSIPLVWGIRNFILSGITKRLAERYDVFYAVPEIGKAYMLSIGVWESHLIMLRSQRYSVLQRLCSKLLHKSHRKRFPTASDEVFKPLTEPMKKGVIERSTSIGSYIFQIPFLYNLLEWFNQFIYRNRIDRELFDRIEAVDPLYAISTSYVVNTEWSLFGLLHARGVPIYTHILSFDNLTSRGYLPIKYFDGFLVWNSKMALELRAIYGVSANRIEVTGTPQFDFHTHPYYHRSREWTGDRLGINAQPYILYCANHFALTPDEPALVERILCAFRSHPILTSYKFILRLHPMDNYDRWNELSENFKNVKVNHPWSHQNRDSIFWGEPSLGDVILFSNMIRYCDLVMNIASTVSIDAAILNKPVVCIGFSSDFSDPLNSLYKNFHFSDHYAPIMQTGATPIASDVEMLLELSQAAIQQPWQLLENRKQLVELLCGEADGEASQRIVNYFLKQGNG